MEDRTRIALLDLILRSVIINDFDVAKQVMFDDNYMGRGNKSNYLKNLRGYGRKIGLASTDGATWKVHRRFTLATLKGTMICSERKVTFK